MTAQSLDQIDRGDPPVDGPGPSREDRAHWSRSVLAEAMASDPQRRRRLRQLVVIEHLWLAETLAARYRHRGEDSDDLYQVACAGLIEAAGRFDPEQGDFVAFAAPTIHGLLKRHFRDHGWLVRPPRRTQELAGQVRRAYAELAQQLQRSPTDTDLAELLGGLSDEIRAARVASEGYHGISLDLMVEEHHHPARHSPQNTHWPDSDESFEASEARLVTARAFELLDADERQLLTLRYYDELSQVEIARIIGTSQMQVSRKLAKTLTRLRSLLGIDPTHPTPLAAAG